MKYRRARQAAWRKIAGETVLLDLERKRMYGLNPVAGRLWQVLETAENLGDLRRRVVGDVATGFGNSEVEAFLTELVELGLAVEGRGEPKAVEDGEPSVTLEEPEGDLDAPAILWREEVEQIAGTCAFFPSQNPLCDQVPFS